MSERELVRELKETIKDLSKEKDLAADAIKLKESRIKQVLIKLEHATNDVSSLGHKIGEQSKQIQNLELKLETKERLLNEALEKIRELKKESNEETNKENDAQEQSDEQHTEETEDND